MQRNPATRAAALTGYSHAADEARCRAAGFQWFIPKPTGIKQIADVIESAILALAETGLSTPDPHAAAAWIVPSTVSFPHRGEEGDEGAGGGRSCHSNGRNRPRMDADRRRLRKRDERINLPYCNPRSSAFIRG